MGCQCFSISYYLETIPRRRENETAPGVEPGAVAQTSGAVARPGHIM